MITLVTLAFLSSSAVPVQAIQGQLVSDESLLVQGVPSLQSARSNPSQRVFNFSPSGTPSNTLSDGSVSKQTGHCFASRANLDAGTLLSMHNLIEVACLQQASSVSVRFDRHYGVVRLSEPAAPGAYIGPLSVPVDDVMDVNAKVSFSFTIGSVTIEKEAKLLQPARPGDTAFVRDSEGQVFSVRLLANQIGEAQ